MELKYFQNFFRANYPNEYNYHEDVDAVNEALAEVGIEFKKYLEKKFKGKQEKLNSIWGISPIDVIPNMHHPFYTNGYNPALIILFDEFCSEMKQRYNVKHGDKVVAVMLEKRDFHSEGEYDEIKTSGEIVEADGVLFFKSTDGTLKEIGLFEKFIVEN